MSGKMRQQEVLWPSLSRFLCSLQTSGFVIYPKAMRHPSFSKLLEVQYLRDEMKPDSSFIIPSSSFGGPGDMAVQQLHGAHNFCEIEEVNPTEPV